MYFENIRTYWGNVTVFRGKCFLLSEQKLPSFREKQGSSSPGARLSSSESSRFYLFISWFIRF
ncbi:hypothetical protein AC094_42660 [Bacteroides fragilis]|uniref:Uncharacterized protein n=1 Tax=Bacteroides fragilis TaxID=817 RepID=A0A853PQB3_BACFG|nr:hypothetical protein M075_4392 [Bacteroides fragilis str. 20793-3]OCR27494.1 hypothetical protein AC094_42660 [Bacteroides fragilis]